MAQNKEKAAGGRPAAGTIDSGGKSTVTSDNTTKSIELQAHGTNGHDPEFDLPLPTVADVKRAIRQYYDWLKLGVEDDLLDSQVAKVREMLVSVSRRDVNEARKYSRVLIKHLPGNLQERAEFDLLDRAASQEAEAPKVRSEDYIKALAGLGYTFRLNQCDDSIEVNTERLSDPLRAKIRTQIRDMGFKGIEALEDAYTANAYDNGYHPIKEYFAGLEWDGNPNIATLASYFTEKPIKRTDKDGNEDGAYEGIFYTWLRRWLIGSVAKVYTGSQNPMLVLEGKQDLGKSYFPAWLTSPMPGYFYEGPINTEDKDSHIRLMNKWVWEVAELGATTRKTDRESLKYFLTLETVIVRKPYGRLDTIKPAMASFVGTINNEAGFLSDPTGSRRFLVCSLEDINWDYAETIDPAQIWAEAHAAYQDGETWRPTADERAMAHAINQEYEIDDPIEDLLRKYYILDKNKMDIWTATTDILDTLEANGLRGGHRRSHSMALASTLKRLGFEKHREKDTRGYKGIVAPTPKPIIGD